MYSFSDCTLIRCNPFSFFCISVIVFPRSVVCSTSIILVWFAKGSVFLEGFKVTTLVCGVL